MILDEATSALDSVIEQSVADAIKRRLYELIERRGAFFPLHAAQSQSDTAVGA